MRRRSNRVQIPWSCVLAGWGGQRAKLRPRFIVRYLTDSSVGRKRHHILYDILLVKEKARRQCRRAWVRTAAMRRIPGRETNETPDGAQTRLPSKYPIQGTEDRTLPARCRCVLALGAALFFVRVRTCVPRKAKAKQSRTRPGGERFAFESAKSRSRILFGKLYVLLSRMFSGDRTHACICHA